MMHGQKNIKFSSFCYRHPFVFIDQQLSALSEGTQHFEHCAFIYHL